VTKRVRVVVSGRVQGVGFRWYCRDEAERLAVSGFVRNLPDGRVEAAFEGEPAAVDAMVQWCREGPAWARVGSVDVSDEPPIDQAGFAIAR
jgi:acylphosphatase